MMVEQAFRVAKDSRLYKEYFEAQAEKQKMHDLARAFFKKHDLINDGLGYRMIATLAMQLTPEQEEKYKTQLKVTKDTDGMRYFKCLGHDIPPFAPPGERRKRPRPSTRCPSGRYTGRPSFL